MAETTYLCTNPKCAAVDHDRSNNPPMVLNCYKCGAGRGMDLSKMMANQVGMVRVSVE